MSIAAPGSAVRDTPPWQIVTALVLLAAALYLPTGATAGTVPNPIATCAACHGGNGQGNAAANIPALAGLPYRYLYWQLRDFANGRRTNAVMDPIAHVLTTAQIDTSARYYSALPPPAASGAADTNGSGLGKTLARQGRWSENIPACDACHGPHGMGASDAFPRLTGQPARYLAAQLHAWQKHQRPPGPQGLMQAVAGRLSNADIEAVTAWYARAGVPSARTQPDTTTPRHIRAHTTIAAFQPPPLSAIPATPFGATVRRGYDIFTNTPKYAGQYIGNHLSCTNCHLDAGRLANAGPLWAAWPAYPAYREKNHRVNSYADRLDGCFRFSMNGKPPPADSDVIRALQSYSFWLASGAPVGASLPGRGYPKLASPAQTPDYARGKAVYARHCALCHMKNGAGVEIGNHTQFPALWGPGSFNWGAGMAKVNTAADFIHANMPFGLGRSLSTQQAWDVALYMDSHERPQDPRYTGSVVGTRKRFHTTQWSMYGRKVNGHILGDTGKPK